MTSPYDDEAVRGALRTMGAGEPVGDAPIGSLLRQGRRARVRRTGVIGAAAGLSAAAVASAVAFAASPSPPQARQILPAAAPTSFRVEITMTGSPTSGNLTAVGAFDPATRYGYLTEQEPDGRVGPVAEIEVDGVCYLAVPLPITARSEWLQLALGCFTFGGPETGTAKGSGPAADPDAALRQLADSGDAKLVSTQGSGDHAVQNWAYFYVASRGPGKDELWFTGTMTVDLGQKHVIRMTEVAHSTEATSPLTEVDIYEFSDFGVPVKVSLPSPGESAVVNPTP